MSKPPIQIPWTGTEEELERAIAKELQSIAEATTSYAADVKLLGMDRVENWRCIERRLTDALDGVYELIDLLGDNGE
jgi:hypothetical protein